MFDGIDAVLREMVTKTVEICGQAVEVTVPKYDPKQAHATVAAARATVETRMWRLANLLPKRYGVAADPGQSVTFDAMAQRSLLGRPHSKAANSIGVHSYRICRIHQIIL